MISIIKIINLIHFFALLTLTLDLDLNNPKTVFLVLGTNIYRIARNDKKMDMLAIALKITLLYELKVFRVSFLNSIVKSTLSNILASSMARATFTTVKRKTKYFSFLIVLIS